MPPSTLLSLKEVVIDSKIKMNEQELTNLDQRTVKRGSASWSGVNVNPRGDACMKLPEPSA